MCESSVYDTDGNLIMEDTISIKINGKEIVLLDILNQKKVLNGFIEEIDLEKHNIYINMA